MMIIQTPQFEQFEPVPVEGQAPTKQVSAIETKNDQVTSENVTTVVKDELVEWWAIL